MSGPTLYMTTYGYNADKKEIKYVSFSDKQWDTDAIIPVWTALLPVIKEIAKNNFKQVELYEGREALAMTKPQIILLFIDSKELANSDFFDVLATGGGSELRPHVIPTERHVQKDVDTAYYPIITIAEPDITYLYSEEKDAKNQHEWNKSIYSSLEPDKRFKFLDSSIWHRYVPIDPFDGYFGGIFEEVLKDIVFYYEQGLYFTNASVISLEFQMRMLLHSYVARFGDKGHSEVVTPFKFHSERQMAKKVQREADFLMESWGEEGNNLLRVLKWRFLIVDDQANLNLSLIRNKLAELYPRLTKMELIIRPLAKLYRENNLHIGDYIIPYAKDDEPNDDIVENAIEKISEFTYDIIFLDYLLGKNSKSDQREYGHEFLLKLLEDNRADFPVYKRDFLGKYWIFPISSYPHALTDKLAQLGISNIHEIWHIAQGADPISVPHFYAYNLLRFIKQKVGKFFLYPNGLKRLINQIPTENNIDSTLWMDILSEIIKNGRTRLNLLNRESVDENSSLFVRQMKLFVKEQRNKVLSPMFDEIERLLEMLNEGAARRKEDKIRVNLELLMGKFGKYSEGLKPLELRINRILNHNHDKAVERINNTIEHKRNTLSLAGLNLQSIPKILGESDLRHIERLELNGNFLSSLPFFFVNFKNLEYLDLSNNAFEEFPSVLEEMKNLSELNFGGNKLELQQYKANSYNDIMKMKLYADGAIKRKQRISLSEGESLIKAGAIEMGIEKIKLIIPRPYDNDLALFTSQYNNLMDNKDRGLVDDLIRQLEDIKSSLLRLIEKVIKDLNNP